MWVGKFVLQAKLSKFLEPASFSAFACLRKGSIMFNVYFQDQENNLKNPIYLFNSEMSGNSDG